MAVLKESYGARRYILEKERGFFLKDHAYVRSFDFYFTDNNSIIGKPESSVEQAITQALQAPHESSRRHLSWSEVTDRILAPAEFDDVRLTS